jgi:hypothetical protein
VYSKDGAAGVGDSTGGATAVAGGGGGSGAKANDVTDRIGGRGGDGVVLLTWVAPAPPVQMVTVA